MRWTRLAQKCVYRACAIAAAVVWLGMSSAHAQTPQIEVHANESEYSFGQRITCKLSVSANTTITQVNLVVRIQGQIQVRIIPMDIGQPARQVALEYDYNPIDNQVPVFAHINYHWQIYFQGQQEPLVIAGQPIHYLDNLYQWQYLPQERFSIYWIDGDARFAEQALNTANQALLQISQELRLPTLPDHISIYIYPNEAEAQRAMELGGRDWMGGQARPDLGVIVVGIPNNNQAASQMRVVIPHEISHMLVYEYVGRALGKTPPWLDEGLATSFEQLPSSYNQTILQRAFEQDRLIPLSTLCGPFSLDADTARLSYAQSSSIVSYLRDQKGSDTILALLDAYADGASCEGGVHKVLGKGLDGLDASWRAFIRQDEHWWDLIVDNAIWLALWLLSIFLVLPLIGARRQSAPNLSKEPNIESSKGAIRPH